MSNPYRGHLRRTGAAVSFRKGGGLVDAPGRGLVGRQIRISWRAGSGSNGTLKQRKGENLRAA